MTRHCVVLLVKNEAFTLSFHCFILAFVVIIPSKLSIDSTQLRSMEHSMNKLFTYTQFLWLLELESKQSLTQHCVLPTECVRQTDSEHLLTLSSYIAYIYCCKR